MTSLVLVAILATGVAFLLSAAETALQRTSRARAQQLSEERRRGSEALRRIVGDPGPYLAVAAFGRVTAESLTAVAVAVAVATQTDHLWQTALIAVAIMVLISFVLVGVSPRTLGAQHAEDVALLAAPVIRMLRLVLGPAAKLLVAFGNAVTPGRGYDDGPFASEAELREFVDLAGESAVIQAGEQEMIHSIFELGDTVAREVMVPRPDMVTVGREKTLRQAMSLFLRSGFSRVPVIGEHSDDVLGLLYFKDVARHVNARGELAEGTRVTEVMRGVHRIPDSKPVDGLLREMQQQRLHFAMVIDEYGGTAGLVTIEDILEEIVGEITDEYDRDVVEVAQLPDGRTRVPASLPVDDLADMFDTEIEVEDVDTVGGLLASTIGMVPIVGSVGEVAGLQLTAERMAGRRRRVATVLVEPLANGHADREDPDSGATVDAGTDSEAEGGEPERTESDDSREAVEASVSRQGASGRHGTGT